MAENIINKFSKSLDQGLASLYDRDALVDLENQYGNTYEVRNSATGPLSDARHMAAMNNLSNSLSPMNNRVGNFIGDIGAFGAGLVNEVPAALTRGFNKENYGEIMEDIAANYAGSFGTPNTTTAQQIYNSVFSRDIPTQTASNIGNYGTAQAAEVNPNQATNIGTAPGIFDINQVGDPALNPGSVNAMGIDPFGVNEDFIDRGNPFNDSRVVSEEQGLSGFPGLGQVDPGFQNALNAREARMNEIAMQQNPNYGQFFDAAPLNEEKRNVFNDLLGLASLAYTGPYQGLVKGANLINNIRTGKVGQIANRAKTGLGSLGSRFAGTMRGINPITGKPNTQAQYEANREAARTQNRIDNMLDRKAKGKSYSEKNLSDLIGQQIAGRADKSGSGKKSGFTNPGTNSYGPHKGSGGNGSGGGKIVCTMMNERYGFGSFRNKIWMKFHEHHGPEYQKGYHAIFLPLVKIAKGEGKINTAVRKVLEHMGRHVTADMFKIMKGKKRDTLGRIYRAIFEPACHIIGKIKSALGRG